MNSNGLHDKVTIITGASRGIGRATAEQFAKEGAILFLNYRQDDSAMEKCRSTCAELGAKVEIVRNDIGDCKTAQEICSRALDKFGRIDILINNAGTVVENLLVTLSSKEIDAMISTNILGTVWMTREAVPAMLKQRSGCIVNLSSASASKPGRGNSVYAGTKGFVESFTKAMAVEVGRKNIRVNAVAPGVIDTDMTSQIRSLAGDTVLKRITQRRFGKPKEIASVIAFLASDKAEYLNGAIVPVDGAFLGGV